MEEKKSEVSIPFVIEAMGTHNRRMLIALVTVCLTFIVTIIVFVTGYTQREKNWLDTLGRFQGTEVADGIHEQPNP